MIYHYINSRKRLRIGFDEDRTPEWLQIELQIRLKYWWWYFWKTVYYSSCQSQEFLINPYIIAVKTDKLYQKQRKIPVLLERHRKFKHKKAAKKKRTYTIRTNEEIEV